jgi:hypothetical protein
MLQAWVGLTGCSLLVTAAVLFAVSARKRSIWLRCLVLVCTVAVLCMPIEGHASVLYLRGLSGDFSVTSMILLGFVIFTQLTNISTLRISSVTWLFGVALTGGLLLYPFELGLTQNSPYELGYGSRMFFSVLLLISLMAWWAGELIIVYSIAFACAGYLAGVLESRNLWDYVIDTPLVFFAAFWLIVRMVLYCVRRKHITNAAVQSLA